ncbi:enoyl-[acyl-carrier-protein] reductase [NADH] [Acetobacter sp. CAG:977]|nr:enoyl-[acyl-carrier-protein] reductase [NADH] [Acetobacter sp. CAG:977]
MTAGLMTGKKGLILGLANDKSIAWGIASKLHEHGAKLAFTYQGEALEKRVRPLAASLGEDLVLPCDVTNEESMDNLFAELEKQWGTLDFVVHAVAFSDKNELKGRYCDTTLKNFLNTMHISCYSFTEICRRASKITNPGGSFITMTYYGAEKTLPNYNVMGVAKAALEASVKYLARDLGDQDIRVNAISAGPIKTLAASGVGDFRLILNWNEYNCPMHRNVTIEDVGGSAVYLLSDLANGVTGEILHVDNGYNTIGMVNPDYAHESGDLLKSFPKKNAE